MVIDMNMSIFYFQIGIDDIHNVVSYIPLVFTSVSLSARKRSTICKSICEKYGLIWQEFSIWPPVRLPPK